MFICVREESQDKTQHQQQPIHLFSPKTVFYVVGPATHRALLSSPHIPPSSVYGSDTGNGDKLARFIQRHYNSLYPPPPPPPPVKTTATSSNNSNSVLQKNKEEKRKPPLLFLVGETRRDIIPRTLMMTTTDNDDGPSSSSFSEVQQQQQQKIQVEEKVVYETKLLSSFADDLQTTLDRLFIQHQHQQHNEQKKRKDIWIVVFSPTGCKELLTVLGILGSDDDGTKGTGCAATTTTREGSSSRWRMMMGGEDRDMMRIRIATIGPTTRSYLIDEFGFRPHICAEKPTPEGVADAIRRYVIDEYECGHGEGNNIA